MTQTEEFKPGPDYYSTSEYTAQKIAPGTWLVRQGGATAYLVATKEEGIVVDSCNPGGNLRAFAEEVCGVPVPRVICTHGHIDHTGGNTAFDEILISEQAEFIMREYYQDRGMEESLKGCKITTVKEGDTASVGLSRQLEVFSMGVHSPGSIALLEQQSRILFTGDDVMGRAAMLIWRCPEPQGSLFNYVVGLSKLMARRADYDWVACGHATELKDGSLIELFLELALSALHGNYVDRVERFGGGKGSFPDPEYKKEAWGYDLHISFDERYMWDTTHYTQVKGS